MLVYFFADVFFETFANPEIVIPPPDGPVLADSEAANRYFFLTSYFALISITTGICLYFWSDISRHSVAELGFIPIAEYP